MTTISIDFGTFNSEAAYKKPGGEVILLQAYHGPKRGQYTIPSFLKFYADGRLEKYGEPAKQALKNNPNLVVWGVKRLLGKSYELAKNEMHRFQYPIEKARDGSIIIPIGGYRYTPVGIVKIFLENIKKDCENPNLNPLITEPITKVIISHPAYFDSSQIEEIKTAAKEAGFGTVELITEPEAAAISYKDIIDFDSEPWVMVIDWGAGTLDVVIARFSLNDGKPKIQSIGTAYGDNSLGGIDIDDALLEETKSIYKLDNIRPEDIGDILLEIEEGKIDLSTKPRTKRYITYNNDCIELKMARRKEDIPPEENKKNWIILEEVLNRPYEKNGCLFSLKSEYIRYLKEGIASDNLITAFKNNGLSFSGEVTLSKIDEKRWAVLENGTEIHRIIKNDNTGMVDIYTGILREFKAHILYALKNEAGLDPEDIDGLILVGGPMYMPCVRNVIKDIFQNNEKVMEQLNKIEKGGFPVSLLEAVVRGAAIYAEGGSEIEKKPPFSYGYIIRYLLLGRQIIGRKMLITKGIKIPQEGLVREDESYKLIVSEITQPIYFSILKEKEGVGGKKYFKIGNYEFHPIYFRGVEAHIQPILEIDKNGVITLKIRDIYSNRPPMTLQFLNHEDEELYEHKLPPDIDTWLKEQERMKEEGLEMINEIIRNNPELLSKIKEEKEKDGQFSFGVVEEMRKKGENYVTWVEYNLDSRNLKSDKSVMEKYKLLKQFLGRLPKRELSSDEQQYYKDVANAITELECALVSSGKITGNELKILKGENYFK